jgi:hypothetical protein
MFIGPYFKAPIENNNNERKSIKKYVDSLKKTSFFSLNEIQISQRILQIPHYSRYFNPILKNSFVNLAEIDDENYERCEQISDKKSHILIRRLNISESKTFQEVFCQNNNNNNNNTNNNNNNNTNNKNNNNINAEENMLKLKIANTKGKINKFNKIYEKKFFFTLINSYKHLLEGIKLLDDASIVSMDFHPSILVFKDNFPIITIFEEFFHLPTINEERKSNLFSYYQPKNVFLPLEAHVICFLIENRLESLSFLNIEEICEDCKNRMGSLSCFSKDFLDKYKETAHFSLQGLVNKPKSFIIQDILEKSNTWNNYGLSILFLVLLRDIFKNRGGYPKNSFISHFAELLTQGIHPNPDKRTNSLQNISLFNDILYNTDKLEFYNLFASLS